MLNTILGPLQTHGLNRALNTGQPCVSLHDFAHLPLLLPSRSLIFQTFLQFIVTPSVFQRLSYEEWMISTSHLLPTNTDNYTNSPRQPRLRWLLQFQANPSTCAQVTPLLLFLLPPPPSLQPLPLSIGSSFMVNKPTTERKGGRDAGRWEGKMKERNQRKRHFSMLNSFTVKCISSPPHFLKKILCIYF